MSISILNFENSYKFNKFINTIIIPFKIINNIQILIKNIFTTIILKI